MSSTKALVAVVHLSGYAYTKKHAGAVGVGASGLLNANNQLIPVEDIAPQCSWLPARAGLLIDTKVWKGTADNGSLRQCKTL